MGTCSIHPRCTSSALLPVLAWMELARTEPIGGGEAGEDVVDGHGGSSRERVLAQDAMAPRSVLDTPMLRMGSLTEWR